MKDYEVIIRPHITEKTTAEAAMGKYSFIVDRKATKIDVKKAKKAKMTNSLSNKGSYLIRFSNIK